MTGLLWALGCVLVVLVVWTAAHTAARVRRLDRLHARLDAARSGLLAALRRRAVAALAAAAAGPVERAAALHRVAEAARAAGPDWTDREVTENRLTRELAALDRAGLPAEVLGELVDAEQLVVLARSVHNDAVRDTAGLRSRRLVRWLRLAGGAPPPRYFEIADPTPGVVMTTARIGPHGRGPDGPV